jgi:hypothetical protein
MKHHDEIANAVQNAVDVGWNNALKHPPAVAQAYHKLFHGTDL